MDGHTSAMGRDLGTRDVEKVMCEDTEACRSSGNVFVLLLLLGRVRLQAKAALLSSTITSPPPGITTYIHCNAVYLGTGNYLITAGHQFERPLALHMQQDQNHIRPKDTSISKTVPRQAKHQLPRPKTVITLLSLQVSSIYSLGSL